MKIKVAVTLVVALWVSIPLSAQELVTTTLPQRMNLLNKMVSTFQERWNNYTKCFTTQCSAEEKQQRRQLVIRSTGTALKAAVGVAILVYVITIAYKAHERQTRTLKIGEPKGF